MDFKSGSHYGKKFRLTYQDRPAEEKNILYRAMLRDTENVQQFKREVGLTVEKHRVESFGEGWLFLAIF